MSGGKFPGLDEIKRRAAVPKDQRRPRGRPRTRVYTPEELAAMSPANRRRATQGRTIPVMTGEGIRRVGVPSKLTSELLEEIVKKLASGATVSACAASCGVSPTSLADWMSKGADPAFGGTLYAELVESVARARAEFEVSSHAVIASGRKGWQGRAWLIERLLPHMGPPKRQLEHSGPGVGGAIRVISGVELPEEIPDGHPSLTPRGDASLGAGASSSAAASDANGSNGIAHRDLKPGNVVLPRSASGFSLPEEEDPET